METEETTKERQWPPRITAKFCAALAAAQAEMGHAAKDRGVEMKTRGGATIKYNYATFAACLDVVRPAWTNHGITYTFDVVQELGDVDYETDSGQVIKRKGTLIKVAIVLYFEDECRPFEPTIFSTPSLDPRAIGSAITYAKRYQLTNASGIAAEDDDDGAAAEGAPALQENRTPNPDRAPPPQREKAAPRAAPKSAARPGPDPAAVALAEEYGRRIKEVADLAGQADLRVQIRAGESTDKASLIEASFTRSIEMATTPEERKPLALEIQRDPLDAPAKARLNKLYQSRKGPAPAAADGVPTTGGPNG